MDIAQIGIVISTVSVSVAVLKQAWGKDNKNGKYMKPEDCVQKHQDIKEALNQRFDDFQTHFDTRVNDLKDLIKKNGK